MATDRETWHYLVVSIVDDNTNAEYTIDPFSNDYCNTNELNDIHPSDLQGFFLELILNTLGIYSLGICLVAILNYAVIPFLFLDDGKGFRIVQNGSRQKT